MFGSFNEATVVGNLGQDPQIRSTQNGGKIANFSVATSENWNDKATGERKEKVQWHRVAVFNERMVEHVEKNLKKGSKVLVKGAMETRSYTDKDGKERETTEVVVGRFKGEVVVLSGRETEGGSGDGDSRPAAAAKAPFKPAAPKPSTAAQPDDDEIPF